MWANGRFSWDKLFEKFNDFEGLGSSVGILHKFLEKIQLLFRYEEGSDVGLCNKHFKMYFRSIVNIDMAPIEGGHRTWILNKKMMGHSLKTVVPCSVGIGNYTIKRGCSLALKTGIIICPWKTGEKFSTQKLTLLSKDLHKTRNRSFSDAWSLILQRLYRECAKSVQKKQTTYSQFLAAAIDSKDFSELILEIKTKVLDVCLSSDLFLKELTEVSENAILKIRETILDSNTFKKKTIRYVSHFLAQNLCRKRCLN